ncbi:MAG TPA: lysophospholipase [Thermodesulfobacteriota bacterium]|nr:lysophospholipase [Thermodesulfobacteriota bacterium]
METRTMETTDGLEIFAVQDGVDNPRGVMVIVHGLAEHSGRYDHVSRKLNENKFSVYRFDLRGHGRSGGPRGDNDDFENFIRDTDLIVRWAVQENPGKPVFMLGHSMGGLIAAIYGEIHGERLKGQIFSGAALDFLPAFAELEKTYTDDLADVMFPNALTDAVCRDPEVVKAYEEDPLVLKEFTLKLLYTTFIQGIDRLHQNVQNYRLPCLILHGGDDMLVAAMASQWFLDNISSKDKSMKIYSECYHEILNEKVEKDQVMADIVEWIKSRS